MSLINQMLRDLEDRRQSEPRSHAGGEPAPVVTTATGSRRTLLLLTAGVLLAVVIWGGSELLQKPEMSDSVVTVPAAVVLLPEQHKLPPAIQAADEKPVSAQTPDVVEAPKPEPVVLQTVAEVVNDGIAVVSVQPSQPETDDVAAVASSQPDEETVAVMTEPAVSEQGRFQKMVAAPSPQEQAQSLYLQALSLQQKGNVSSAEKQLLQALQLNPQLLDARLQLISLLRLNNRPAEAFSQVEEGLQLHPQSSPLRKDKARQLLAAGLLADAIILLESAPLPSMAGDLEYYALLAALLQEAGDYPQAVEVYRNLLSYRPQETTWWLGLAISLDQSGEAGQAKSAYQKVAAQSGLRAELAEYVSSRLQAL